MSTAPFTHTQWHFKQLINLTAKCKWNTKQKTTLTSMLLASRNKNANKVKFKFLE